MRVTYDKSADAVYIYLSSENHKVEKTYMCNPVQVNGQISLDFDEVGKIVGVEVLDASKKLAKSFLESAEAIG